MLIGNGIKEDDMVLITVIIRTFNSASLVRVAIESALNQTLAKEDYEVLVVDDDSTDHTMDILKEYGERIRTVRNRGSGPVSAINTGLEESNGIFIILLDADDEFLETILEKLLKAIETSNKNFAYCDYYERDINSGEMTVVSLKESIFRSVAGGFLIRTRILINLGGYDESLIFPEYDLLIRMLKCNEGVHVPEPLFIYNRRPDSITSDKETVLKGMKQLEERYGNINDIREY